MREGERKREKEINKGSEREGEKMGRKCKKWTSLSTWG